MNAKNMLFGLLLFGLVFAGLGITDYSISPTVLEPGESGTLTIYVGNPATTGLVESVTLRTRSITKLGLNQEFSIGDLDAGSSSFVSIPFTIAKDTPPGMYPVYIDAVGYSEDADGEKELTQKSAMASLEIVIKPIISVSLSEGKVGDLQREIIRIENIGGYAKNVRLEINDPSKLLFDEEGKVTAVIYEERFGFLNKDYIYVAELIDFYEENITLDSRNAEEGSRKFYYSLTYEDKLGNNYYEESSIQLSVKKEGGDFLFTALNSVITGKDDLLQLKVKNTGEAVEDLTFTFSGDNVNLIGESEVKIGDLDKNAEKVVEISLNARLQPGSNSVAASLEWIENNEDMSTEVDIPIKVTSDSEVGIYLGAKPEPLSAGQEHILSITVANLGSYAVEGTTVRINGEGFQLLSVQPEQYIGGLETDDFSSVQFKIKTGLESGEKSVHVLVDYKDVSGEWMTAERTIPINILSTTQDSSLGWWILGGVIVLVAIGIWYWKGRKK